MVIDRWSSGSRCPGSRRESCGRRCWCTWSWCRQRHCWLGWPAELLLSVLTVTRFVGIGEWFALPWGTHVRPARAALVARVAWRACRLATLWLMPLTLLAILANALVQTLGLASAGGGRWVLGSVVMEKLFGQPLLGQDAGPAGAKRGPRRWPAPAARACRSTTRRPRSRLWPPCRRGRCRTSARRCGPRPAPGSACADRIGRLVWRAGAMAAARGGARRMSAEKSATGDPAKHRTRRVLLQRCRFSRGSGSRKPG
jgi:hypothetical protein